MALDSATEEPKVKRTNRGGYGIPVSSFPEPGTKLRIAEIHRISGFSDRQVSRITGITYNNTQSLLREEVVQFRLFNLDQLAAVYARCDAVTEYLGHPCTVPDFFVGEPARTRYDWEPPYFESGTPTPE